MQELHANVVGRREFPRRRYLGRNPRIPFTSTQVSALEAQFAVTRYLSGAQVHSIAVALGLTETRVKIWFQNRRAREKRERQPHDVTEHDSTAAPSAPLRASLAADTVRLTPTLGFDMSRPLHEWLNSPTVLAPSVLETGTTRQFSLNRSGTNFSPPFGYWPGLPVPQWSMQGTWSFTLTFQVAPPITHQMCTKKGQCCGVERP
ncbi:homeobox protein ceh-62-like isoform X1 [Dermacentor silvarum]|uniref:homeobox protein ceh-62-like isoform X1 n=1 Tax=Dermacentor silvarum TaxID=543639 RepID=UPI002101B66F|nr:homeobox protein ceh-62-like isoform X1 [Dermacentor silvarum]